MGFRFQVQNQAQTAGPARRGRRAFAIPRLRPAGPAHRGPGLPHSSTWPASKPRPKCERIERARSARANF